MHEVSLGGTLLDYLTGEQVERTTYEDLRQALARMLVEEKGYPSDSLRPRVDIPFHIDGEQQSRTADLVAYDESDRPLLLVIFCAGAPGTYDRESVASARLIPGGPAPLVVVTDTRDAVLLETSRGRVLANGMAALPAWTDLRAKAEAVEQRPLSAEARQREERILHAYTGFLKTCCGESCDLK
ncbi:type I restriction enzyme HsdR N-terminal domain-containing protein [Desulfocurvibacter africanus]|uniref:Type I restriction enzyme R protein N-terminal domain-containing protein n=2 Tax=Desulfocurvibacter africanus TaxID=873 RepID=F3Z149_DESAF|nr:type I restriction enzyme HsdR N-terminal domain-containing protein [Desulfocurvibacter africanus]EGJ49947.1 hypothetical protein Desaf_1611 [Desulfocurvibacter africanus subsp. africanus str. Walvis Bay]